MRIRVWRTNCYMRHEDKGVEESMLAEDMVVEDSLFLEDKHVYCVRKSVT
jgi:hypothetical protein